MHYGLLLMDVITCQPAVAIAQQLVAEEKSMCVQF